MALKELDAEVTRLARQGLAELGFKKRAGHIFTRDLHPEFLGWIGLNMASRGPAVLEINTVVGVRHQPTERLLAELKNKKFHPYVPPTLGWHLGYLMPEKQYRPWLFPESVNHEEQVRDMVETIRAFALPFMEENTTPEAIISSMVDRRLGIKDQNDYRLPVLYHLLGRQEDAGNYLQQKLERIGNCDTMAADHYRRFAEALLQRMNS